ncbi:MAG: hypothetical protein ACLT40_12815 [Fusobacterium sp.]
MKKLLFITALLAMGTMAFGNPNVGEKANANVEVKARIVDGNFIISDIDGKPIVLDFGDIYAGQKQSAVTYVDYKVTSKEAAKTDPIKFDITLGGNGSADKQTDVIISTDKGGTNGSMKAVLGLSEYKGIIEVDKTEYRGRINGTIANTEFSTGKPVGTYLGNTKLEITVSNN